MMLDSDEELQRAGVEFESTATKFGSIDQGSININGEVDDRCKESSKLITCERSYMMYCKLRHI